MTRVQLKLWLSPERRPVLDAWLEGKTIQFREPGWPNWVDDFGENEPFTARSTYEWRVKPEPRQPRRIWVNEYDCGPAYGYHETRELADSACIGAGVWNRSACVEFVEVIKEGQ